MNDDDDSDDEEDRCNLYQTGSYHRLDRAPRREEDDAERREERMMPLGVVVANEVSKGTIIKKI